MSVTAAPADPTPNVRTVIAHLEGLAEWNFDKTFAQLDDAIEHLTLPKSLGRPILNKKQYAEYFTQIMPMYKPFKVNIEELVESGNVVVVHATWKGFSGSGCPYSDEYMVIFHLTPGTDGDGLPKIIRVKEFVDSEYSKAFFKAERERMAKSATAISA